MDAKITFQRCYILFVNKYGGQEYTFASAIFKKLSELRNQPTQSNYLLERFTLTSEEAIRREQEMVRDKRLLSSLEQFALMLTEYPIRIFYSNGHDGEFSSKDLFSIPDSINQLLKEEFESLNGKDVYVNELDYKRSHNLFFNIYDENIDSSPEQREFFAEACQDSRFLAGIELFKNNGKAIYDLFKKYPKDEHYQEDGEVSVFLQKTYGVSSTEANRNFLRMLKSIKPA